MQTVMIAIRPEWVEKILSGEKTLEIRKSFPNIPTPFKVVMYCTKAKYEHELLYAITYCNGRTEIEWSGSHNRLGNCVNGKVCGEFICDEVTKMDYSEPLDNCPHIPYIQSIKLLIRGLTHCLSMFELKQYGNGKPLYAWHITSVKAYSEPRAIGEFRKPCIMPEMPYCPSCKYGNVQYSSDEVESSADIEGASCQWICTNTITRPPQSWMRIEEDTI